MLSLRDIYLCLLRALGLSIAKKLMSFEEPEVACFAPLDVRSSAFLLLAFHGMEWDWYTKILVQPLRGRRIRFLPLHGK